MKTKVAAMLILGGLPLACVAVPKGGGELVDSGNDDGGDSGDGEDSGGDAESDDGGEGSASATGTGGDDGATTAGTTGGVPFACEDTEWGDSLETFEAGVASMGNTYWYTQTAGGSMGFELEPCTYETRVEIVDGAIVRRTFSITETDEGYDPADCFSQPYLEEGDAINTNDEAHDALAYTMDEIYAGCCELLAIEPAEEYEAGMQLDDNGILSACWAVFANCADGCATDVDGFASFSLASFNWGETPS